MAEGYRSGDRKGHEETDHQRESPETVLAQAASVRLFALQLLLEEFDSCPALQWSPDGASEQPLTNLPGNRDLLLTLAPQASQTSAAWQQPVKQRSAGIEATFTPAATGFCPDQVPASM